MWIICSIPFGKQIVIQSKLCLSRNPMPPHKKFTVNKNQGMDDTESVVQSWQDITGSLHVRWLASHKFNYVLGTMFPGGKWVGTSSRLGFVFTKQRRRKYSYLLLLMYTRIFSLFSECISFPLTACLHRFRKNKSIIPRSPMKMTFPWWNIAFFSSNTSLLSWRLPGRC